MWCTIGVLTRTESAVAHFGLGGVTHIHDACRSAEEIRMNLNPG